MASAPAPSQLHDDTIVDTTSVESSAALTVLEAGFFSRFRSTARRGRRSLERGATAVEYGLMVGLVAVGIVTAVSSLREKTIDSLSHTASSTSGLVFDAAVQHGTQFTVKYVRNDLGVGGFATVVNPGTTTSIGATGLLTQTAGDTQYLATLTAPAAPGIYEVQVRKSSGSTEVLENGRLRVE
jgi:Flp pilus assembly pilin Flp